MENSENRPTTTAAIVYVSYNIDGQPLTPDDPLHGHMSQYFEERRFQHMAEHQFVTPQLLARMSDHYTGWLRDQSAYNEAMRSLSAATAQIVSIHSTEHRASLSMSLFFDCVVNTNGQ